MRRSNARLSTILDLTRRTLAPKALLTHAPLTPNTLKGKAGQEFPTLRYIVYSTVEYSSRVMRVGRSLVSTGLKGGKYTVTQDQKKTVASVNLGDPRRNLAASRPEAECCGQPYVLREFLTM